MSSISQEKLLGHNLTSLVISLRQRLCQKRTTNDTAGSKHELSRVQSNSTKQNDGKQSPMLKTLLLLLFLLFLLMLPLRDRIGSTATVRRPWQRGPLLGASPRQMVNGRVGPSSTAGHPYPFGRMFYWPFWIFPDEAVFPLPPMGPLRILLGSPDCLGGRVPPWDD